MLDISKFSSHLFWDTDQSSVNPEEHKSFIVQRVLEYGLMEDWKELNRSLDIREIASCACELRTLEPRALHFISLLSDVPLEQFRCYNTAQSMPDFWNS